VQHDIHLRWDDDLYQLVAARARAACRTVEQQLTWEAGLSVECRWLARRQISNLLRTKSEDLAQIAEILKEPPEPPVGPDPPTVAPPLPFGPPDEPDETAH